MEESQPKEIIRQTPSGEIRIRAFLTPEEIRSCSFDSQFGTYAHFRSLYTHRESLEKNAGQRDANVTVALAAGRQIVGFAVLAHPEPEERWARLGPGMMMEIKAIEVARDRRAMGIAGGLVRMLLSHPRAEEMIVYLVGYSWTWDLDGTGKTAQEYRKLMIRLFEPHGFKEYQTNEPNICLKGENLFMGRVGKNVSKEVQDKFKWLRFGIYPQE
jgi:acetoin utilization protein AcuA